MTRSRPPVTSVVASSGRRGGGLGEPAPHPVPPAMALRRIAEATCSAVGVGGIERPLLVDSRAVARLLGISRTKAFQMMAAQELPTVRIGRSVRVSRIALDEWIHDRLSGGRAGLAFGRADSNL
jgi:excisionase family DNA binding protein